MHIPSEQADDVLVAFALEKSNCTLSVDRVADIDHIKECFSDIDAEFSNRIMHMCTAY